MFPLENWEVCAIGSDEPGAPKNWPPHLGAVAKKSKKNISLFSIIGKCVTLFEKYLLI
jgi:hypothetical protein